MTTIDDVSTNDMNIKHLDTTKNIVITPKDEFGNSVQLNASHTWTAKVSDGTNYVGDYQVTLESNSIVVNSADFTNLPAGQYHLEVWEEWIDSNSKKQRSIYPSPQRTIDFNIYQNVTDLAEKEIKSIGFQDVVDQAVMNIGMNYVFKVNTIEPDQTATVVQSAADGKNYVAFNIPRGVKGDQGNVGPAPTLKIGTVTKLNSDQTPTANISGDNGAYTLDLGIPQGSKGNTGTVDNTGLISAPAFQNLQTQVNDSAVGTNLLTGTAKFDFPFFNNLGTRTMQKYDDETNYVQYTSNTPIDSMGIYWPQVTPAVGQVYTLSADVCGNGYIIGSYFHYESGGAGNLGRVDLTNDWQRISNTFRVNSISGSWVIYAENSTLLKIKHIKIEKGSVATDWTPNPEEILTQSDYAKIKAAIVALGGSLS